MTKIPLWYSVPPSFEALSPQQSAWLQDPGSLTQRLIQQAGGDFCVQILYQGWQPLREDECHALALAPNTLGWVREVHLCGQGQPWVFARSVAGQEALQHSGLNLSQLGGRPLGELLFTDSTYRRTALQFGHYPGRMSNAPLWARRSAFCSASLSLLVAEVFLPSLWHTLALPTA